MLLSDLFLEVLICQHLHRQPDAQIVRRRSSLMWLQYVRLKLTFSLLRLQLTMQTAHWTAYHKGTND